jgi:hypothetical protein
LVPFKRMLSFLAFVGVLIGSSVTPAAAAGNPYGPPVLPPGGVPGGFGKVFAAVTVPSTGGNVTGKIGGISFGIHVPPGAAPRGEQVVVTISDLKLITSSEYRQVPKFVRNWRPVFALGVLLQVDGRPTVDKMLVTIRLNSNIFARFDYLVEYSPAVHGFVPFPKFHTYVAKHEVIVLSGAGTELVVLTKAG